MKKCVVCWRELDVGEMDVGVEWFLELGVGGG